MEGVTAAATGAIAAQPSYSAVAQSLIGLLRRYREGRTWVMANPDAKRMPRGVCLRRREAAARDVQVFCEAREKGNRSSTN